MPMELLNLPPQLKLGPELCAIRLWHDTGPIVLVEVTDENGAHHRARLDIHKRRFIDPLPHETSPMGINSLISIIRSTEKI